jgi:hypothetical protein
MDCMICGSAEAIGYKTNGKPWADAANTPAYRFCKGCARIALRRFGKNTDINDPNLDEWVEVLRNSWSSSAKCFQCQISHVPLNLDESHSPLYATLDHVIPRSRDARWQLVAAVANDMKTDMNMQEFMQAVALLASHFQNADQGTTDLAQVFAGLKHWKR